MGRLEPRFAIVTAIAGVLAVVTFVLTELLDTGGWHAAETLLLIGLAVTPGVLLGRTGVPDHVGTWGYEAAIAFVAGGVVAAGTLAAGDAATVTGASAGSTGSGFGGFLSIVVWSWGPVGAIGYLVGVGSTLVDSAF